MNRSAYEMEALTVPACASFCADRNFQYVGLEWSTECYCSNSMPASPLDDSSCARSCGGDSTMRCGGGYALSVYEVTNTDKIEERYAWESEAYTGRANGAKNPIYLGGHAYLNRRNDHGGSFVGNVANLGLFDRAITGKEADCLFRQGERKIGSCRAPGEMWGQTFWNAFTDGVL